jgi:hypothetical protein
MPGMSDLGRAVQDLAAARVYPERLRVERVAEYRRMLNVAVVLAVLAILASLVVALV